MTKKPKPVRVNKTARKQRTRAQLDPLRNPGADSVPLKYSLDWFKTLKPLALRQAVLQHMAEIENRYPHAERAIVSRLAWVAQMMDRMECYLTQDLNRPGRKGHERLRRNIERYNGLGQLMVKCLEHAERQEARWEAKNPGAVEVKPEKPWRGLVVIPEESDATVD